MEKNMLKDSFLYKNESFDIYFDTLNEKIWVERKVLERLSNKSRITISKYISRLIIDGIVIQNRNIKRISTKTNHKLFLYDKTVLKEIISPKAYQQLDLFEKRLIENYNKEHKKIYFKNGFIGINKYLINNVIDIKLNIIDVSNIFDVNICVILKTLKKNIYDIYDIFYLSYVLDSDKAKEINNSLSNILIKCIIDGYYINNELCQNDKNKIINITKIADNILGKEKLDDEEKRKYYKNTISYKNELYESSSFLKKLIQSSKSEIIIISKYMDDDIFSIINISKVKTILYSSKNSLVTKYYLNVYNKTCDIELHKTYLYNDTYIIIDDDVYYFDVSIINILKSNSICIKKDITKSDLFSKLKI